MSRVGYVDERTNTTVGAQGGRSGGAGSVWTSPPTISSFNGHDSFESCGYADARKLNTCKTIRRVDGLARTTKPKTSPARARADKTKARAKTNPVRAKARARTKETVNNTARNGRKDFKKWRRTKTNKKHKLVEDTQSTLTTGLTQTGGRATGAQICELILHGSNRQDSCHRRSRLNNSPIQHLEETFQC